MQPEAFIWVTIDSDVYSVRNWVENCSKRVKVGDFEMGNKMLANPSL